MKHCGRKDCQNENPQSESAFARSSSTKDGLAFYCRNCASVKQREYKSKNPEAAALRNRRGFLKYFYGMTLEQYNELLEKQGHRCAICKTHALAFKKALHVDHNHETGKIRELLCANCNHVIGKAREQTKVLRAAIKYLERHEG